MTEGAPAPRPDRLVLRDLTGTDARFDDLLWERFRSGVDICRLHGDGSAGSAALLRYQPGASVPAHEHSGYEHIFVLTGSQRDERERYAAGTLVIHGAGTSHVVSSEEGCVALAIWQAPVRFGRPELDACAPSPANAPGRPPLGRESVRLAVVGAHLRGLPLNPQLVEAGARFVCQTCTAPVYRLYLLAGTEALKPGLLRVATGGESISIELWDVPRATFGAFVDAIPAPLGIGTLECEDGELVKGFVCESYALDGAQDISAFGGFRAFLEG